jgi:hypothetical protein
VACLRQGGFKVTKPNNIRNYYFLAALTVFGDTALALSFRKNTADDIIGITLALLLSAMLTFFIKWVTDVLALAKKLPKNLLSLWGGLCAVLLLLFSAVLTLMRFSNYAAEIMLGGVGVGIPALSFGALFVYTGLKGEKRILKLSALFFAVVILFVVTTFVFSARFMSLKYLIPYKEPTVYGSFSAFWSLFPSLILSGIALTVICRDVKKRHFPVFYAIGGGLTLVCAVGTLGIFGSELAESLDFPYSHAVETASLGHVFSRLDGLLYGACFLTCGIKISASISAAAGIIRSSLKKYC